MPDRVSAAISLDRARQEHSVLLLQPRLTDLSAPWSPVGPSQVTSALFGSVTGRVTAVAIDPADATGNTVYLGTTGGGVWKSTNAAGPAAAVAFNPLTDTLPVFSANAGTPAIPSLSIGALSVGKGNGIVLAGTGDPNDATDSYYGAGLLRSRDAGATWTLAQGSLDGVAGNHSFIGLSFAGIAFSSVNPSLVVAAVSQAAEGDLVNAVDQTNSVKGLYFSTDAGVTWHMANVMDGGQTVQTPLPTGGNGGGNAATSVVWNAVRQRFYAAVRFHGYYESVDGTIWTRLANQPGIGLTTTACPANAGGLGNPSCPIFRGVLAVQPVTGDMFALTVDTSNRDQGLYQDVCAAVNARCASASILFGSRLDSTALEGGNGSSAVAQADYNLSLAASDAGTDTVLYVGAIDLYRCTLAAGCSFRNTTNAQNGCANGARVAPAEHAIAAVSIAGIPLVYVGNDGGVYRSTDGVDERAAPCSPDDANHFQNLNGGLGSLAEVESFAQDPVDPNVLLAGLGALGTASTGIAASGSAWGQLANGEGGTVAINPANPLLWYLSTNAGVSIAHCNKGAACTPADFALDSIGEAQVANDVAAIHAPWILDPALGTDVLIGTCRVWRGPAESASLWSNSNLLSRPFGAPRAAGCSATFPIVRSLAAGGPVSGSSSSQSAGSEVLYAGIAGTLDGGQGFGGHLFATTAAQLADGNTVWSDVALSSVTNDFSDANVFNPGGFDVSSVAADLHDATGRTVYATIMGFSGNGTNAPHVYRSLDAGGHWTNISSNLPNAPANSIVVDPNDANTVYVALDTGVYVATQIANCTNTNCWSIYGSSLPNAPVIELRAGAAMATGDGRTGELRAATYGRGIWQIPLLTATNSATAGLALSPTALVFSDQQQGSASSPISVLVTNTGNAILFVNSVATAGDFSETDDCVGVPIAQGANCMVQVRFLPSAIGTRSGVLTVYGNITGGQATATLTGTGSSPSTVVLNPLSVTFSGTNLGATSKAQNITISNLGKITLNLQTPVISGDFMISANTCGSSLAPSTGCTVGVVFVPSVSGTRIGTLTVVDDAGTQTASLTGLGTSPATDSISPLALSFSAQQLNTTSLAQQITLINAGDVALTLIAARITNGDFEVVNSCGNSLNAHGQCTFSVAFVPRRIGQQQGLLAITDQFRTQTVQLNGFGVAPPGVSLSPLDGFTFEPTGLGLSSAPQTVTLTNNGALPLAISSVAASGDFSVVAGSNTCGALVAPGVACTAQISFNPTLTGTRIGMLTFVDSAPNAPQTLQLTGTGIDFTLTADGPTTLTVSSGKAATYGLLLRSAAGLPGDAKFTCSGAPAHATCTVNPGTVGLGGTTLVTVTVATGLASASAVIPSMPWRKPSAWLVMLMPMGGFVVFRRRRYRFKGLVSKCLLSLVVGIPLIAGMGCGSGRLIPGDGSTIPLIPVVTPNGTYTLLVAASSAGLVRTVNVTLVVQ